MMNTTPMDEPTLLSEKKPSPKVKPKNNQKTVLFYRIMIFYRFALATIGGYALATFSAMLIAQYFSEYRGSAAMSATLIAFTLQACAFIWVFMVNKTFKATLGIMIPTLILYLLLKMLG